MCLMLAHPFSLLYNFLIIICHHLFIHSSFGVYLGISQYFAVTRQCYTEYSWACALVFTYKSFSRKELLKGRIARQWVHTFFFYSYIEVYLIYKKNCTYLIYRIGCVWIHACTCDAITTIKVISVSITSKRRTHFELYQRMPNCFPQYVNLPIDTLFSDSREFLMCCLNKQCIFSILAILVIYFIGVFICISLINN